MQAVYDEAAASGLFDLQGPGGIKVRIHPFQHFLTATSPDDFIHVFANMMEGRSTEQKKALSDGIVLRLKEMFPNLPIISMNVRDFERATYCNREMA